MRHKSKLRDLVTQADNMRGLAVAPLFGPIDQPAPVADQRTLRLANASYEAASALQGALQAKLDTTSRVNGKNAKLPRGDVMTIAEIDAKIESYCQRMLDIGDLPGNPRWTVVLAQWGGENDEHKKFAQWRDFARHLAERRITKADVLKTLNEWKPKRR